MKKAFTLLVSLMLLCLSSICSAGIMEDPVAVMPFGIKTEISRGISPRSVEQASYIAADELSVRLNLVERENIAKVIEEMRFQMTDLVDQSTAVQFGKMVGAKYVVIGNVTSLSRLSRGYYQSNIAVRIVEVETGRVAVAGRGSAKAGNVDEAITMAAEDCITGEKGIFRRMGF